MLRHFPNAKESRYSSRTNLLIFREIRDIEEAILLAQIDGKFETEIQDTTMTYCPVDCHSELLITYDAFGYWRAWKGFLNDRTFEEQMKNVISYFKDLDYSIVRKTNSQTDKTFKWIIKW